LQGAAKTTMEKMGQENTLKNGNSDEVYSSLVLATLPPWGVESPSIGLGYLDSYIRGKGVNSEVYDFNIYFHNSAPDEYKMLWHIENKNYWSNEKTFPLVCKLFEKEIDYAVKKILSSPARLVGFSVVDPKERITIEVIRRVKEKDPRKKIILGGPACSTEEQRGFFTDNLPEGNVDYFVVGEGEETLYEIIKSNPSDSNNLPGTAYKEGGIWKSASRGLIEPLDSIPFPDYRAFDLNQYVSPNTILVEWSRGCLGHCSFCKNYRLVQGYRRRSPENIIKELLFLRDRYRIDSFTVCDNLMNGDPLQLEGVCEGMIRNNLEMSWSGQIAPHRRMHEGLFVKMRRAGCSRIQIGVESGSDSVLKMMKKPYSSEVAEENIKAAKKAGMETEIFIIVGFPGEGENEFGKTVNFIRKNHRYLDTIKSINTLHLIAGTEVYEKPGNFNLAPLPKQDWHYLWESLDGNNYAKRKKRAEELLDLASSLGLKVQETNIQEGKEAPLSVARGLSEQDKNAILKDSLVSLQELPSRGRSSGKKRGILSWLLLVFLLFYIMVYIMYFWILMSLGGRVILGGRKK